MNELTRHEKALLYLALVTHDGATIRPDWDPIQQRELTTALDKLRATLLPKKTE